MASAVADSPAVAGGPRIAVVGSGFGAVACARELLRAGHRDVTILEGSGEMGWVWRDNTYPAPACDIPSPNYSYSFAPNPGWSRRYARQDEIHDYLRRVARDEGVDALVTFGAEVVSAAFDDDTSCWLLRTADGSELAADVLISTVGQLSRPAWPLIRGLDLFSGHCFHSAVWDHDFDATAKDVAVIGTAASAVQFVPELARVARSVTVFQASSCSWRRRHEIRSGQSGSSFAAEETTADAEVMAPRLLTYAEAGRLMAV